MLTTVVTEYRFHYKAIKRFILESSAGSIAKGYAVAES